MSKKPEATATNITENITAGAAQNASDSTVLTEQRSGYLTLSDTNFAALISEELAGLDVGFERIKIPSGGVTSFEMPMEDGDETESVRDFSGVIIHQHPLNAYYSEKYTGGSNPPTCGSFDGVIGVGNPGGYCKKCPLGQFGSGENGAKTCKNRRRVYILREGEMFPLLLSLPTGSLKALTKYLKVQLSKGRKSNSVVTRFGLKKAVNTGGIAYSQATFTFDRTLTAEEHALIESLSASVKAYSETVGFDGDGISLSDDDIIIDHESGEVVEPLGGGSRSVSRSGVNKSGGSSAADPNGSSIEGSAGSSDGSSVAGTDENQSGGNHNV